MIVPVLMLGNQPEPVVRNVVIRSDYYASPERNLEDNLEEVFRMGQNENQPIPGICSVSIGDVIVLKETIESADCGFEIPYLILSDGFEQLSLIDLFKYITTPRRDRVDFVDSFLKN